MTASSHDGSPSPPPAAATQSASAPPGGTVVAVAGAGRGPLRPVAGIVIPVDVLVGLLGGVRVEPDPDALVVAALLLVGQVLEDLPVGGQGVGEREGPGVQPPEQDGVELGGVQRQLGQQEQE